MQDILLTVFLITSCAALSGFYYDNGLDQTIVHKHLSKREKKEMQSEILHLLGLEHRPRPALVSPSNRRKELEKNLSSAPRFLIDVYQSLTEEDSGDLKLKPELIEREFNVSDSDVNSMDEADVIMSFINQGKNVSLCFTQWLFITKIQLQVSICMEFVITTVMEGSGLIFQKSQI